MNNNSSRNNVIKFKRRRNANHLPDYSVMDFLKNPEKPGTNTESESDNLSSLKPIIRKLLITISIPIIMVVILYYFGKGVR